MSLAHLHMQGLCLGEGGEKGRELEPLLRKATAAQLLSRPLSFSFSPIEEISLSFSPFFLSSFLPPSLPSSLFFVFFFLNFESENNSSASSCMLPTPVYYTRERSLSLPTVLALYCSMTNHFQNSPIKHIFSFGLGLPDKVLWIFDL